MGGKLTKNDMVRLWFFLGGKPWEGWAEAWRFTNSKKRKLFHQQNGVIFPKTVLIPSEIKSQYPAQRLTPTRPNDQGWPSNWGTNILPSPQLSPINIDPENNWNWDETGLPTSNSWQNPHVTFKSPKRIQK
jgi:hypothetical protein